MLQVLALLDRPNLPMLHDMRSNWHLYWDMRLLLLLALRIRQLRMYNIARQLLLLLRLHHLLYRLLQVLMYLQVRMRLRITSRRHPRHGCHGSRASDSLRHDGWQST